MSDEFFNDAPFRSVAESLRIAIRHGEWAPGETLPSMNVLAHKYGVHRNTIGAAMQVLQEERMVVSHSGSGTIVPPDFIWRHLAVLLPDIAFGHWATIYKEIDYFMKARKWSLELFQHHGRLDLIQQHLKTVSTGEFAGMIFALPLALLQKDDESFAEMLTSGFPMLFIGGGLNCWSIDDRLYECGYWGTKHLIDQKYKRIAFVGCRSYDGEEFIKGCRQALDDAGLEDFGTGYAEDEKFAIKILDNWLLLDKRPDAIFYQRADHGQKCFYILQAKRIQLGSEMGFMVLDDTNFHRYTAPGPSAIRRYPERIGKKAVELFLELVNVPKKERIERLSSPKRVDADIGIEPGRSTSGRRKKGMIYRAVNPFPTVEDQLLEYYPSCPPMPSGFYDISRCL